MTPEEKAYALAETRIAEAKAGGHRYLNLSGDSVTVRYSDEARSGDAAFKHLTTLPPQLTELTQLRRLDLDYTQVSNLTPLNTLTGLQVLYLISTQVSDLTPLGALNGFRELYLNDTPVSDLTPLRALTGLQELDLDDTQVSNLTPLSALTGLQRLDIDNAPVSALNPIADLTELKTLYFRNTPACTADPKLEELSQISGSQDRTTQTLAYLREKLAVNTPAPLPSPSKGGVRFVATEEHLDPLVEGEIGPLADALRPLAIEALEEMAKPLPGSNRAPDLAKRAERALSLLRDDTEVINAKGHELWTHSIWFGRYLDSDKAIRDDPESLSEPLTPEMRRMLEGVIDTLPNLTRQFPVARYLDEEKAAFLRNRTAEAAAGQVVRDAVAHAVIREETAEELETLTKAPEEDGIQAAKQARASVFSARNLLIAALGAVAVTVIGETTLGVTDGIGLRQKISDWIRSKPEPIEQVLDGAPADVAASIRAHIARLKDNPAPWLSPKPPHKP
ncbi:MAG: leucine-rich repeat domain-containing protein [Pseudomonadota bacterium]